MGTSWIAQSETIEQRKLELKSWEKEEGAVTLKGAYLCAKVADVYLGQKNYGNAKDWYQKALNIHRKLGNKSPEMAECLLGVSQTMLARGSRVDARKWCAKALENAESLGASKEVISRICDCMGDVYIDLEYGSMALKWYQRAAMSLDVSHPHAGDARAKVAEIYSSEGKDMFALEWLLKAAESYEVTGANNSQENFKTVAGIFEKNGYVAGALQWRMTAHASLEKHPQDSKTWLANLRLLIASNCATLELFDEALNWHSQALELIGDSSPLIPEAHACLACIYKSLGKNATAYDWYKKSLGNFESFSGPDGRRSIPIMLSASDACRLSGDYAKALDMGRKALDTCMAEYGANHPCTAASTGMLGKVWKDMSEPDVALKSFQSALSSLSKLKSSDPIVYAELCNSLGDVFLDKSMPREAMAQYDRAITTVADCALTTGITPPVAARSCLLKARVLASDSRALEALEILKKAVNICEKSDVSHTSLAAEIYELMDTVSKETEDENDYASTASAIRAELDEKRQAAIQQTASIPLK
jgi:tetratricopeptide (TPR) repeat protein